MPIRPEMRGLYPPDWDSISLYSRDCRAGLVRDGRPPTARCGGPSGYAKHRRLGEEVCEACRRAYNDYQRAYQRRYRAKKKQEEQ